MPLSSAAVVEAMMGVFMEGEVEVRWLECVIGSGALKSMSPGLLLSLKCGWRVCFLYFLQRRKIAVPRYLRCEVACEANDISQANIQDISAGEKLGDCYSRL